MHINQALFSSTSVRYTNARNENIVHVLNNIKRQPKNGIKGTNKQNI